MFPIVLSYIYILTIFCEGDIAFKINRHEYGSTQIFTFLKNIY